MVGRWTRAVMILVVAALAALPGVAAAQSNFPSQQGQGGSNFPSQQGPSGSNFPSQQGQQPGGRGGFFQSQQFGFSFNWGPGWELLDEGGGVGFDGVSISNGASLITVMGIDVSQDPQNPQQFVETLADALEIPDLRFSEVVYDETDRAAAVYESNSLDAGLFIDAIRLDPTTMLTVVWRFPRAQFDAEVEAFGEVMSGLTF